MIGLQSFAFLVLAGLTQVYSKQNYSAVNYIENSFPYYRLPPASESKHHDLYTSSIVSYKSGPLCSGFHMKPYLIVTAASCVHRHKADSLTVMSNSYYGPNRTMIGPQLLFFQVKDIHLHSQFNVATQEHDIAVLHVDNSKENVAILNVLSLNAPKKISSRTDLYFVRFSFDDALTNFYAIYEPAEADTNTRRCGNGTNSFSFICVSRVDYEPYSYGLADIGTPLILRTARGDLAKGMFTFRVYNAFRVSYLYQSFEANLDFLTKMSHEINS